MRCLIYLLLLSLSPGLAWALESVELVVAHRVEDRQPVGVQSAYAIGDGQVYAYLTVANRKAPAQLVVRWYRDGAFVVADPVKVGIAQAWRTWLRRRLRPGDEGAWRVVVASPQGLEWAEAEFTVSGAAEGDAAEARPVERPVPAPPTEAPLPETPPNEPLEEPRGEPGELPPGAEAAAEPEADPPEADPADGAQPARFPCRGLLNLRISPPDQPARYAVADLRFGDHAEIDFTDGLVQRTEQGLELLWTLRREDEAAGPHGVVERGWDEVWGLPLAGGTRRLRAAVPATLGPPEAPVAEEFYEDNRLEVVSVLGPWLGLSAVLRGRGETGDFDGSRLLTVGTPNDLKVLVGEGIVQLAWEAAEKAVAAVGDSIVGVPLHDFRQAAFVPGEGGLAVWARLRCCRQAERLGGLVVRVGLHAPPPSVRPYAPDNKGIFRHGGCAVGLSGPRLVAQASATEPLRVVPAHGLLPFGLLGVIWLDAADAGFRIEHVEAAAAAFLRSP